MKGSSMIKDKEEDAGVSFQQIQKYERGINRITGSKFICFSQSLNIPISTFFEGTLDVASETSSSTIQRHLRVIALLETLNSPDMENALFTLLKPSMKGIDF